MKKNKFKLLVLFTLMFCSCLTQNPGKIVESKFNFDLEEITQGEANGWATFGNESYYFGIDSLYKQSGKYSAYIEHNPEEDAGFKAWALEIPGSYEGKEIILSGYIKTENVSEGHAGLWMRIDPDIGFDNMASRGIVGTTDWKKYSVVLKLNPLETDKIVVGALLVGKGKIWVDNLSVTIDGKDIRALEPMNYDKKEPKTAENSNISSIEQSEYNIKTIYDLGLIWGFLKYYHPTVRSGKCDWDSELLAIIPKVIDINDYARRDVILEDWIKDLGEFKSNNDTHKIPEEDVKIQPDLSWIDSFEFSNELKTLLTKVKYAERGSKSHYVKLATGVMNPTFTNESKYSSLKHPDVGYSLLSLYRYWNMIQYYFPYKYVIGEDWKGVLARFIPRFIVAQDELEYNLALLELIGSVNDTHANIWNSNPVINKYKGLNIATPKVSFIENKPVITGFYNKDYETNLKVGDIITEVNGEAVNILVENKLKFYPASNYPTKLRDIASDFFRTSDSLISISYLRDGVLKNCSFKTYPYHDIKPYKYTTAKVAYEEMSDNIGYLYPALLKKNEINSLWEGMSDTKGLIIDLRCYPSDFIVFSLGEKLLPKSTPFVNFSHGNLMFPGLFSASKEISVGKRNNPKYYKGKIVILINEQTQSQAEYTAMALRTAPNAVVIGSTTAAADGNISWINLPGGIRTAISGIGVYYPNGDKTQRVGIIPNIELMPTINAITQGRDEMLEKALEVINSSEV